MISGNDITYDVRANLDRFAADLRRHEQMATTSAERVRQRIARSSGGGSVGVSTLARQYEVAARSDEDRMVRQATARAVRQQQSIRRQAQVSRIMEPPDRNGIVGTDFMAGGGGGGGVSGGGGRGTGGGIGRAAAGLTQSIARIAKVAVVAEAAMETASIAWTGLEAAGAALTGDMDKGGDLWQKVADKAKEMPLLGVFVRSAENLLGAVTGITADIERIERETAEVEAKTKKMAQKAARQEAAIREAEGFVGGLEGQAAGTRTEERQFAERIAQARAELAKKLEGEGMTKDGKLTDTGREIQERGQRAINEILLAESNRADFERRQESGRARAAELRGRGDVGGAEEVEFDMEIERSERAAAERGAAALEAEKAISAELRRQFQLRQDMQRGDDITQRMQAELSRQREERERAESEAREAADLNFEAEQAGLLASGRTMEARRREIERDAQRRIEELGFLPGERGAAIERKRDADLAALDEMQRREAEDIGFTARQDRMRRMGLGDEADVQAIVREAQKELEAGGGNQALEQAILERAREQMLGVQAEAASRTADVISGSQAQRLNFGGGRDPIDKLNETNEKQLGYLKTIADKVGAPASTSA
jgi:hypothetical protein